MPRLIIGNLDAEADFAVEALGVPRLGLRLAATNAVAEAGTLLRAFARASDTMCLPASIAPGRVAAVAGLARPTLEPSPPTRPSLPVLAWAETPAVARMRVVERRSGCHELEGASVATSLFHGGPLHEVLWRLPVANPAIVAACNDRQLALDLGTDLGARLSGALPGARMVSSLDAITNAARQVAGPWVVKARFSAAGRWRYIHRDGPLPQARLARLLARHGSLVFEPWVARTDDFGVSALLDAEGKARMVSCHRQTVDREGRFRGLETTAKFAGPFGLRPVEERQILASLETVAGALHERGYVGPFGIDAWRYRTADGGTAFRALGEINARMTFGLVARALIDRLRIVHGWRDDQRIALRFGPRAPDGGLALLLPDSRAEEGGAIWLEVASTNDQSSASGKA